MDDKEIDERNYPRLGTREFVACLATGAAMAILMVLVFTVWR